MTPNEPRRLPSPALLFCPADRPERYAKAMAAADGVILDLEDGVGADAKDAARAALVAALVRGDLDADRVIVRVNAIGTPQHTADLAALRETGCRLIMLPKSESRDQLAGLGDKWQIVALCETPLGVVNAAEVAAAPNVIALMWGAEDLIASMLGRTSRFPDGRYRDVALHARSTVLLAAGAHGKPAVDAVYVNIPDLDGLAAESQDAAASGFTLKACIHPSQVAVVRTAFRADEAQVAWAQRVIAAARDSGARDKGAITVDGQMVDAPLIRQAEAILASVSPDGRLVPEPGPTLALNRSVTLALAAGSLIRTGNALSAVISGSLTAPEGRASARTMRYRSGGHQNRVDGGLRAGPVPTLAEGQPRCLYVTSSVGCREHVPRRRPAPANLDP